MDTSLNIRKESTCGTWLEMNKQSEKESYSHRKRTKVTIVEEINPITKKTKIELRILAAMDSCLRLIRPRQHGVKPDLRVHTERITSDVKMVHLLISVK